MESLYIKRAKACFALVFMLVFVVNAFFPSFVLDLIMAPVAVVIFILAFPRIKGSNRNLSIVLLVLGVLLLAYRKAGWENWVYSLSKNAGITVLLLSLPLLKIVLLYEDFETYVQSLMRKYAKTDAGFYLVTSVITIFIGVLINVASIPMVYQLLEKTMKNHPKKLFYEALTRSFCTNMLWCPSTVSVAVALQYMSLTWFTIAPVGFLIAVLGNLLGFFMMKLSYKAVDTNTHQEEEPEADSSSNGPKDVLRIISLVFILIFLIVLLTWTTKKSVLVIVPLLSFTFPAAISVILRKIHIFGIKLKEYLNTLLPAMNGEIVLFTSVAFFGYALGISDIIRYIPLVINKLGFSSPLTFLPLIIFIIISLAMIGLHPLITVPTIAAAFSAGGMPVTDIQLAFALMCGYFLYTLISPFSGLTLITCSLSRESPFSMSIRLNLLFALLFTTMLVLIVSFI